MKTTSDAGPNSTGNCTPAYEPAQRPFLVNLIRSIHDKLERYLRMQMSLSEGKQRADQEHREIVAACRAGDAERAAALIEAHIVGVCRTSTNTCRTARPAPEPGHPGYAAFVTRLSETLKRPAPPKRHPVAHTPAQARATMQRIRIIDSHTGGEPTRLVIGGFPDLGQGDMAERRRLLGERHDAWRAACILEPRGSDVLVGALLCAPVDPEACAGVIFFNNSGYLGMCGHGTIGLVASLAHLGRIGPGVHRIETPVGEVEATLHEDGSVSVRNVPAYRYRRQVSVEVPGIGRVSGDIAWGGNWFFLVAGHGQRLAGDNLDALTAYTVAVQQALDDQDIRGEDGGAIDHIELFADDPTPTAATSCSAPARPTTARPAAPAPAPSWPAWPPTASCCPASPGARRA